MSEERKLKLIWDFRGPEAESIATHHTIHLEEYVKAQQLSLKVFGSERISEAHAIAYIVVTESEMRPVRDALKPHRGQIYQT